MEQQKEEEKIVPIESLVDTMNQILATPVAAHVFLKDNAIESIALVEQEVDKPSSGLLDSVVQQITNVYTDLTTPFEESTVEKTALEQAEPEIR